MTPIGLLMHEHRNIERLLGALEAFTTAVSAAPRPNERAELARFVDCIRRYADAHHHAKEEEILFVAMVEAGFPKHAGPIAVMLQDHDAGRELVGSMAAALDAPEWTPSLRADLQAAASEFSQLLRHHIQKEDRVLYPMAEGRLSDEAMADIARRFDEVARPGDESGATKALEALLEELVAGRWS